MLLTFEMISSRGPKISPKIVVGIFNCIGKREMMKKDERPGQVSQEGGRREMAEEGQNINRKEVHFSGLR